jgi:predicted SpoU family rRNA methylase
MPYRYYTSGSPTYFSDVKNIFRDDFQSLLDNSFLDSSSVYTIQEETSFASGSWVNIEVRINRGIDRQTGNRLSNDFKMLLFRDLNHSTGVGYKYNFDNNIWLTTNIENYKNLAKNSIIRRCNNVLKWVDENGNYYSEPCVIDYEINNSRDEFGTSLPIIPQGYINIYCQLNSKTRLIKGNQRFLFGQSDNRVAFRVFGNGIRNFINDETISDSTVRLLVVSVGADSINEELDDLVNGIADYNKNIYSLTISPSAIYSNIGETFQIIPTVTFGGNPIIKDITYSTSASSIATISASGVISFISAGSVVISGYMTDNIAVNGSAIINVSASGVSTYEIRISPTDDIIYENETETYSVYLFINGVQQANAFVFTIADNNVPIADYAISVLGNNSFSVTNNKFYLSDPLIINCTSGSYSKQLELHLRGAW